MILNLECRIPMSCIAVESRVGTPYVSMPWAMTSRSLKTIGRWSETPRRCHHEKCFLGARSEKDSDVLGGLEDLAICGRTRLAFQVQFARNSATKIRCEYCLSGKSSPEIGNSRSCSTPVAGSRKARRTQRMRWSLPMIGTDVVRVHWFI